MAAIKPKTGTTRKKQVIEEKIPGVHIGVTLKDAREAQGLSLENVSNELMIRQFYLESLENGNFKDLPERVYATGFVRNYAQYLGLEVQQTIEQFKRDAYGTRGVNNYKVDLSMPEPVAHSIVPNRSAIISALVVLAVLIAGVVFFTQSDKKTSPVIPAPMTESAPMVDARPAGNVENSVSVPPAESAPSTTGAPEFTTSAVGATNAPNVPNAVAPVIQNRRVIEALQSSWVEIKDPAGKTLFTNILKAGQLLPLPENMKVTMTTGNAGGLRLVLDGAPQPAFGQVNEVKRAFPIDVPTVPATTKAPAER